MNGNKLFYNGVQITGAISIPNYNPAPLTVQFTGAGSISLSFVYRVLMLRAMEQFCQLHHQLAFCTACKRINMHHSKRSRGFSKMANQYGNKYSTVLFERSTDLLHIYSPLILFRPQAPVTILNSTALQIILQGYSKLFLLPHKTGRYRRQG